jgi:hypothetical protein
MVPFNSGGSDQGASPLNRITGGGGGEEEEEGSSLETPTVETPTLDSLWVFSFRCNSERDSDGST